jgi:hypothetical protein
MAMDKKIKGIIYYTDMRLKEPLFSLVQKYLLQSGLPIVSVSLNHPIKFGENYVFEGNRSYPTMVSQIILSLEKSKADYVFFCEHDVLYPKSHFDFTPPLDNIFYYNRNVWRWQLDDETAITYDRMLPLSCLCVNRKFALDHYKARKKMILEKGWNKDRAREPRFARIIGYEPGTKKKRRGGFNDDDFDTWSSTIPVVDVRHRGTFSNPKITIENFKHQPLNWKKIPVELVPGWNLKELFNGA